MCMCVCVCACVRVCVVGKNRVLLEVIEDFRKKNIVLFLYLTLYRCAFAQEGLHAFNGCGDEWW